VDTPTGLSFSTVCPRVVGRPAMSKLSFVVIGTPNSGADLSALSSSTLARVRARSKSRTTTALILGSSRSTRAM
jgi:hypothetical protein